MNITNYTLPGRERNTEEHPHPKSYKICKKKKKKEIQN